jgi:hypothetical protein
MAKSVKEYKGKNSFWEVDNDFALAIIIGGLILVAVLCFATWRHGKKSLENPFYEYEDAWHEDFNPGIAKTLSKNYVSDCAEFRYKQRKEGQSEFFVYCKGRNMVETAYLVFPSIGKITGPVRPPQ